ncbi:MAG: hypothetical protein HC840_01455 [Leptolyngbyaceae cyanobacterium RM2_2_4]|nr:hypothetical protein [Leptolyngbyaceae cyanobacterium SM1_4_3]NJO48362.1 hypothetical protein [Leptolyngbyaceae cyanobacterium RM2_2_4]
MPWLPFFADDQDAEILLNWLNSEDEIAFIVLEQDQDSCQRRWKAVNTLARFTEQNYSLWYIPAGSLFLKTDMKQCEIDPWKGWIEKRPNSHSRPTCFGRGSSAEVRLELRLRHRPYSEEERRSLPQLVSYYIGNTDLLPISSFQWVDNYYTAPSQTWHWWTRLTTWMAQNTTKIDEFPDRDENGQLEKLSFWAFPSAFSKLKNGMAYYANGYDLDVAIRDA